MVRAGRGGAHSTGAAAAGGPAPGLDHGFLCGVGRLPSPAMKPSTFPSICSHSHRKFLEFSMEIIFQNSELRSIDNR